MTEYFDTPILVFALANKSKLGAESWRKITGSKDAVATPHALAECFNVLTYRLQVPPAVARKMILNLSGHLRFQPLNGNDYKLAINDVVENGQTGDKIYDALHLRAALKSRAKKIHTSNKRDFAPYNADIEIVRA